MRQFTSRIMGYISNNSHIEKMGAYEGTTYGLPFNGVGWVSNIEKEV